MHHRKTLRSSSIDYTEPAIYFATLCLNDRPLLMSRFNAEGEAFLTDIGEMMLDVWNDLPQQYPDILLDSIAIMPDHLHGIFWTGQKEPFDHATQYGDVIRWFKSVTTARYSDGVSTFGWPRYQGRLWQRGSYDHVIRNTRDLEEKRRYIDGNAWKYVQTRWEYADLRKQKSQG